LYVIYRALPGGSDLIILYYCLMAMWTGLGDNTELFWAVLSQRSGGAVVADRNPGRRATRRLGQRPIRAAAVVGWQPFGLIVPGASCFEVEGQHQGEW
jgi:hypothetical protein